MTENDVTFVNVFDVEPSRQHELLDQLARGTEEVIRHRPGFLGLTLLASIDGRRVINVTRWASPHDATATQSDPEALRHAQRAACLAAAAPGLYRVAAEVG
jgi:heme-degrading monooxygenase HmoA